MAKAKTSGRKQNSSGGKPTRKTAKNAVRNPAAKKALSAKAGATGKPKGPAGKKPVRAKGVSTTAPSKAPRSATKPAKKSAAKPTGRGKAADGKKTGGKPAAGGRSSGAGARIAGKQPSTTARKPGVGRGTTKGTGSARAPARKRRLAGEAFPPPAQSPEPGMNIGSAAPDVRELETSRQTVPPAQPAEDEIEMDIGDDAGTSDHAPMDEEIEVEPEPADSPEDTETPNE